MRRASVKPSKSISVRERAERADINRGTFYIHYQNVNDLLQRLKDEMATPAGAIIMDGVRAL